MARRWARTVALFGTHCAPFDELRVRPCRLKNLTSMNFELRPSRCGEELGRGSFGTVYQGIDHETGVLMAIKVFNLDGLSPEGIDAIATEIRILQQLNHPHIVKYLNSRVRKDGCLEVHMELVPGGTITDALTPRRRLSR